MSFQSTTSTHDQLMAAIEEQQDRILRDVAIPEHISAMMDGGCGNCGFYGAAIDVVHSGIVRERSTSPSSIRRNHKRWKYIADNDLNSYGDDRIEQAIHLGQAGRPEQAIVVLDADADRGNKFALIVWAACFDSSFNTDLYNPDLALALYILAASKYDAKVETNIARLYAEGAAGAVDLDAAIYWLNQAISHNDEEAKQQLADLYKTYDDRYGPYSKDEFSEYVHDLERVNLIKVHSAHGHYLAATQYAAGRLLPENSAQADKHYQRALDLDPEHVFTGALALKAKALRSYLGIQENVDLNSFKEMIDSYTGKASHCSGMRNKTNHSLDLLRRATSSLEKEPVVYNQIKNWLKALDNGKFPFRKAIEHVRGQNAIGDGFLYSVWAMKSLAESEGRSRTANWRELWLNTLARRNALQINDLNRSSLDIGPSYNEIDDSGLPVLGTLLPASNSHEQECFHRRSFGYYTPIPGIISFEGIEAKEGAITFQYMTSGTRPAFLFQEDFDVVFALMFGQKDPIWPSLSIEEAGSEIDDKAQDLKIKVWNPSWLASTDFGRTMYIVDSLTGALGWSPASFSVGSAKNGVDKKKREVATDLLGAMRLSGGGCAGYCSGRIMLRPEHVPIDIGMRSSSASPPIWSVKVGRPKIMVDGAFMAKSSYDGPEDRNFALNDTRYRYGRTAHQLTLRYDAIAELVPVFERFRQMMALLYAVAALREEKNFKPDAALTQKSTNLLRMFQAGAGGSMDRSQRVCRALPLTWEE